MEELRTFEVKVGQYRLLCDLSINGFHPLPADAVEKRKIVVTLTEEEQEAVHHRLLDLFAERGVEEDGEPNRLGLDIEDLLDVFNIYTYE